MSKNKKVKAYLPAAPRWSTVPASTMCSLSRAAGMSSSTGPCTRILRGRHWASVWGDIFSAVCLRVDDCPPASWDQGTWLSRCPSCATLTIPVVGKRGRQQSQVVAFLQSTRSPQRRNRRRRGGGGAGERVTGNATSQHQSGVFPEIHLFLKDTG